MQEMDISLRRPLIPMVRTLISIPAGVLKINFMKYTVSSALGVFVWNLIFVGAGYFLGDAVFEKSFCFEARFRSVKNAAVLRDLNRKRSKFQVPAFL